MAAELYPYKIRALFTRRQERGLKAAGAKQGKSILAVIRDYVDAGLRADGLADVPDTPLPGQTTIDGPDPEDTP